MFINALLMSWKKAAAPAACPYKINPRFSSFAASKMGEIGRRIRVGNKNLHITDRYSPSVITRRGEILVYIVKLPERESASPSSLLSVFGPWSLNSRESTPKTLPFRVVARGVDAIIAHKSPRESRYEPLLELVPGPD